ATAPDGTKIPLWLLLSADHPSDGSGGILLDGYGAYGYALDPWFDSDVFSLVDRGVGYAVAQIRGGGELGRAWYEAGKLEHKETTFTDYIACAEHLITEGYTSPARLCGVGASAGGLLAGAVLNQRPDLFRAYVANVPFVDVLNTMLDASLPLTTGEYDEWGNPEASREVFDRIRAYSPYDNVKAQDYPAILVLAGWTDNRVAYWEPAKWVARMRALNTGKAPLLLHTAFETGHGGSSGRYSALDEIALQYAFVLDQLGRATPD
ncbi:MAG: prolyl oligopeptidase family serine peptidase, partial [Verrucomicrobiales bacterium]